MQTGDRVPATYLPKRIDDLVHGADRVVGMVGTFETLWIIDEGDYAGQWAMRLPLEWGTDAVWCPFEDLVQSDCKPQYSAN